LLVVADAKASFSRLFTATMFAVVAGVYDHVNKASSQYK
jgi:hypothetical protein